MESQPTPTAESQAIDRLADTLREVLSPSIDYRVASEASDPPSLAFDVGNLRRLLERVDPDVLIYADGEGRVVGFIGARNGAIKLLTVNHG